ncbi:MAG: glycosyltransferase, partial [Polyangiaceae bacterium]|nr:glycosyltransferase [Polyangiaceae bacterium]
VTMMGLFIRAVLTRAKNVHRPLVPLVRGGPHAAPRVSIFKPLAGADDDLDANLESFARLDYPSFEILFGVADRSDPALRVARAFAARHPEVDVTLVVTDPAAALNPKVAQLVGLERRASGDIYVISDSNVRVRPGYLRSMVGELDDPRTGVVTSLFSGGGERSLGAAIENLQICASTAPGCAAMDAISRWSERRSRGASGGAGAPVRPFTVGKSMAVRRGDLARLGGFGTVGNVLAEDHVLGARLMDEGFLARLSTEIVENHNVMCSVRTMLERHTRWAKTRHSLFPYAYLFEPLLSPIVVATAGLVLAPGVLSAVLWLVACAMQVAGALIALRLLRGAPVAWYHAPLEIVRSFLAVICWTRACTSRRTTWRGHPFVIQRGSTIQPSPGDVAWVSPWRARRSLAHIVPSEPTSH